VQEVTWFEANEKAKELGGWLATLELEGENDFVFSLVEPMPEIWRPGPDPTSDLLGPWLGGFQDPTGIEPRGGWLWLAEGNVGNPTPFEVGPTYWKLGEPNNLGGQEDYLVYWGVDGRPTPRWNDVPWDYLPRGFVVEVPEPGTIPLLAIGALTLLWRKERTTIRNVGTRVFFICCAVPAFSATSIAQQVFRDDFDTFSPENWECLELGPQGQTCFTGCPNVCAGFATFEHHTYNAGRPGECCRSQAIASRKSFAPRDELLIEARVRVRAPVGNGLVAAFFLYMDKLAPLPGNPNGLASDEIDVELLTNQINRADNYGDLDHPVFHHPVVLAIYNDFQGQWDMVPYNWNANVFIRKLNLTKWNTFRIHWRRGAVDWWWAPDAIGEPDRLLASSIRVLPDEPMSLYFSFWSATAIWPEAWDPNLVCTNDPSADAVCYFDVDYIVVTSIEAVAGDVDGDGHVNLADAVALVQCMRGPHATQAPYGRCKLADFDNDADVDVRDFAKLQVSFGE
jgi:hypothetical protein